MMAISHTLTGATVGVLVPSPIFALLSGVLVHFLLDTLVHWNFFEQRFSKNALLLLGAGDFLLGILLTFLFLGHRMFQPSILAGMLGGNLPDIISVIAFALHKRNGVFHRVHHRIQQETYNVARGLVSQVVVIAFSIWVFFSF